MIDTEKIESLLVRFSPIIGPFLTADEKSSYNKLGTLIERVPEFQSMLDENLSKEQQAYFIENLPKLKEFIKTDFAQSTIKLFVEQFTKQ